MKKLFLILLSLGMSFSSDATVRTVCNMPYSPGQYTTFVDALTASANYDTIYMHGSSINYGAISINKIGIVVIGTGHNPNKQVPLTSNFTTISVIAQNCKLIGLTFQSGTFNSYSTIKRCKILGTATSGGIAFSPAANNSLIEGNVFASTSTNTNIEFFGYSTSNTIIRNNVFNSSSYSIAYNSSSTPAFSFLIVNNLFLGNSMSTFSGIYNAIIDNNIFYRSSPQGAGASCAMNNNISFSCFTNTFSAAGTGNLVNTNPLFINFPLAGANFAYTHDYRLSSSSPGVLTGNDGTDRGIYGGFGYKFNMTGEPAMPEIINFAITSATTIAPGGTLNISVISKRIK